MSDDALRFLLQHPEAILREQARRQARRWVERQWPRYEEEAGPFERAWQELERSCWGNAWIPHAPTPKQAEFLALPHREAFYGGAAGGGKSDALLMGALQYVDVPGYAAILFRRTYKDLSKPGALMDRAHQWLRGTGARWDGTAHQWRFSHVDGPESVLTFGHLENETDKYEHQSAEYQYVGMDELPHFTESQYTYLFSRLRRLAGGQVPLRMRGAANPPDTTEGRWVGERFAVEQGGRPDRPFVSAKLDDNPHLDREEYRASLALLDTVTRKRLEEGDWSIQAPGKYFRREWFGADKILPLRPQGLMLVRRWDLAATAVNKGKNPDPDWTAGALVGKDAQGRIYVCDVRRTRATPGEVENLVRATAWEDGVHVPVSLPQDPGQAGVAQGFHYVARVLQGFQAMGHEKETGEKELRWKALSAQAQVGNVYLIQGPWLRDFLDEAVSVPAGHDDQVDAVCGGANWLMLRSYERTAEAQAYRPPQNPTEEREAMLREAHKRTLDRILQREDEGEGVGSDRFGMFR